MAFIPEDVRGHSFTPRWRGYDPDEVDAYIAELSGQIDELASRQALLQEQVGKGGSDLQEELDAVSTDVGKILDAAREAAESIRLRASADAASWRADALAETEEMRTSAHADAVALRSAAWETSSQMLTQTDAAARQMDEEARRSSLDIVGEAERDAHRLSAEARRGADETLRSARLDAERMTLEARGRANEIIEEARQQAEASQERARALEVRRAELLEELESVRTTISQLEERIETRQEEIRVAEEQEWRDSSTVKLVSPAGEWQEGESVRVVPQEVTYPLTEPVDASELADEVRRLRAERDPELPTEGESELSDEHGDVEPVEGELPGTGESTLDLGDEGDPGEDGADDVGGLFAALRTPGAPDVEAPIDDDDAGPERPDGAGGGEGSPAPADEPDTETASDGVPVDAAAGHVASAPEDQLEGSAAPAELEVVEPETEEAHGDDSDASVDEFALRDQLLLPVINEALRSVKRVLTDEQNVALEQLRTVDDWVPQANGLPDRISDGIERVAGAGYEAGAVAAERLTGATVVTPVPESGELSDHVNPFVDVLVDSVRDAVDKGRKADQGPRELAASVSRVYRSWRTEQAEQRLHHAAYEAYHRGLVAALIQAGVTQLRWLAAAPKSEECRAAERAGVREPGEAFVGPHDVPPTVVGCTCTLGPA